MKQPIHCLYLTAVTLSAVLCGLTGHVAAQDRAGSSEALAMAEQLFVQGRQLMADGDFAAACPKFAASLELDATLGTRLNLARCYEKLGKLTSAWARYRGSAELAAKVGDERRADYARDRARALEPRLPRLVIKVPALDGVTGFRVTRNGVPVDPALFHDAIFVDPGMHRVDAVADDHEVFTLHVPAVEGQGIVVEIPALKRTAEVIEPKAEKPGEKPAESAGGRAPGSVERSGLASSGTRGPSSGKSVENLDDQVSVLLRRDDVQAAVSRETVGYRSWMLLIELVGPVLALVTDEPEVLLPAFALSGPVTHAIQGDSRKAATSLLIRGIPALGFRLSLPSSRGCGGELEDDCDGSGDLAAISAIAMLAAVVVDYGFFAEKTRSVESRSPVLLQIGSVRANPVVAPSAGGDVVLGLTGTF